jgi:hypothetical protein
MCKAVVLSNALRDSHSASAGTESGAKPRYQK